MSQVQKDHTFVIQDLVPNLTALRRTIHNVMSEQQFWMIYFILLVPQLNEDDCRLLSTPEVRLYLQMAS
ncbi:putative BSD domain-containing protein [Helianthus annuus]|nr:putative BSD domain-containing protein [Helianthus annuus]